MGYNRSWCWAGWIESRFGAKKAGKQTLILEARDRVGGRSKAGEICGETIDLGGQWVGPQQNYCCPKRKSSA